MSALKYQFSLAPRKTRTVLACKACRARKVKCISVEQPTRQPCTRCRMKNLVCEYVSISDDVPGREHGNTPSSSSERTQTAGGEFVVHRLEPLAPPTPRARPIHLAPEPSTPITSRPLSTRPPERLGGSTPAPRLPYTGPPPANTIPRYSQGMPYPNLALGGHNHETVPPPHTSWTPDFTYNFQGVGSQPPESGGHIEQEGYGTIDNNQRVYPGASQHGAGSAYSYGGGY